MLGKKWMVFCCVLLCSLMVRTSLYSKQLTLLTENWPPFNYEKNGEAAGISTDIIKAALKEAGILYRIQVLPWARAYERAQKCPNTGIYTIFKLPARETLFQWIKIEGFLSRMYLFRHKTRDDIHLDTLETAKNYRIGVTRETSTHHFLLSKGFVEGENLFPVSNEIQNVFKADPRVQRIDLTTGDIHSIAHWLKQYQFPPDFWKKELFLFQEEFYIGFSKKTDEQVLKKVHQGLKRIKEKGILKRIVSKYKKELNER